jgi:hypothetical protein
MAAILTAAQRTSRAWGGAASGFDYFAVVSNPVQEFHCNLLPGSRQQAPVYVSDSESGVILTVYLVQTP